MAQQEYHGPLRTSSKLVLMKSDLLTSSPGSSESDT